MANNKKTDINNIGTIYGNMLNKAKHNIIKEAKTNLKASKGPGDKELNDKDAAELLDGGPTEKGGFNPKSVDLKTLSDKEKEENAYNINALSYGEEDEENIEEEEDIEGEEGEEKEEDEEKTEKNVTENINNFMKKKSAFEKLYESFMAPGEDAEDLDALGIGDGGEDDFSEFDDGGEDDLGEGGEDQVTLTIDKALAQQLCDLLQGVLGGEGDDTELDFEDGGDEDLGGESDFGGDDFEEDEETLGTAVTGNVPSALTGKNNKIGGAEVKPAGGKASSAYTDTVDGKAGEWGHPLAGAKQPNMGKNNKVGNLKPGQGAFK